MTGDLAKLATTALLTIIAQDEPPLRFVAGAIEATEGKVNQLLAQARASRALCANLTYGDANVQNAGAQEYWSNLRSGLLADGYGAVARVRVLNAFAGMVGTLQLARALDRQSAAQELPQEGIRTALSVLASDPPHAKRQSQSR